ncbi:dolichyl-phosphate-mannose--protein mannosyltransferase [Mycetocola zhujimingii]|uniref:dolichyl-phosphate-mannose--protein mannosyltransferase n=1 Tax=Mycetocola zhujimingii TaxID=2079792 RepID=UPI000D3565E2|nr:phospholipid carrier-dependent glycosyltransferase [Mycetocola zhujimingii]AWB87001.1 phospholipid carrier-dependent glycosyltransferase [Mycetocola zhujimingii]
MVSVPSRESFTHLVNGGTTGDPDAVEPRGSRLDDWWGRLLSTPGRRRLWYWGGPILVTLLAAVLRLWNLGTPHALVFDETFYVKDAWTLLHHGYESAWPPEADTDFNAGRVDGFLTDPSYVVHPPLGKWIIALGLAVFGAADSVGWRISTALLGTLAVLLLTLVARKLLASTFLAVVAGFLFAIDGHAIVMSRVAILDNSLMFFALLGFGFVLADRGWHESRLTARTAERRSAGAAPEWGPVIWWRPWLVAAGVAFGLAAGVKWSGFYFLAAFGLYLIVVDALARRRLGLPAWFSASVLTQGPVTFLLLVPISLLTYLSSWIGWFVTDNGYYRHWAEQPGNAWTGPFSWVPSVWQSFLFYQQSIYNFHVGLAAPHPYSANPLGWLAMIRPTSMWYASPATGDDGCQFAPCSQAITSIANPLIWWAAVAATLYLVYRLIRRREWTVGLILTGAAAGYLPWLMYTQRTVFQFYTIAFEPYLILALTFVIGLIIGRRNDPQYERTRGLGVTGVFLALAALLSAFWYPLWSATTVPFWFWQLHSWLPTWV